MQLREIGAVSLAIKAQDTQDSTPDEKVRQEAAPPHLSGSLAGRREKPFMLLPSAHFSLYFCFSGLSRWLSRLCPICVGACWTLTRIRAPRFPSSVRGEQLCR